MNIISVPCLASASETREFIKKLKCVCYKQLRCKNTAAKLEDSHIHFILESHHYARNVYVYLHEKKRRAAVGKIVEF